MNIVGISAFFHDSACCLLRDGELVAAAEEERFSRIKHDSGLPVRALRYCLEAAGLSIADVDCVAYYENPRVKLDRQLWQGLPDVPPVRRDALFRLDATRPAREIRETWGYEGPIEIFGHHESHAASAYHFSGFPEAALLTVDAVGEWTTTSYGRAAGPELALFEEVHFPSSLGLLYSTITGYLGFDVNDSEYKVMGLAPYGRPRHVEALRRLVESGPDGSFTLRLEYFDFVRGRRMFSDELVALLGRPPREPGGEITPFAEDLAASLQCVLEEILLEKVRYLHDRVPVEQLCMAGGVALNCVANGRIRREGPFRRVFIQPAAGDAGGALGAAALAHVRRTGERPRTGPLRHALWGPEFTGAEIAHLLGSSPVAHHDFRGDEAGLLESTVDRLAAGKVVAWFHGRMELGPRALGSRSILADPRVADMRDRINASVKKREAFRPFAPSVLWAHAGEHFDLAHESPFMLETCQVTSPLDLPAITHVDGSARVQTVTPRANGRYHRLIEAFHRRTGCPVLLNTSFNVRGEPIVCNPVDALVCFLRTDLDTLVLGDFLIDRAAIPADWERWYGALPADRRPREAGNVYSFL
jgi:carbamoyltransferase